MNCRQRRFARLAFRSKAGVDRGPRSCPPLRPWLSNRKRRWDDVVAGGRAGANLDVRGLGVLYSGARTFASAYRTRSVPGPTPRSAPRGPSSRWRTRRTVVSEFLRSVGVGAAILALSLTATATAQQHGGTLRIAYTSITQLDPFKTAANDEINPASLVFDPLFIIGKDDFQPVPHLAESWEAIDDTTWEFRIRRGVMFQDGNEVFPEGQAREVTAEDVVYSIERFLEVSTAFSLGDITSAGAVDDYTGRIAPAAPDPSLVPDVIRLARVVVVPREAVEHFGEEGFARNPIGTGPFELRSFVPDQLLVFERNEDYWLDPYLDRVEFVFIPDPTVQTIAVEAGEVDVVPYLFNIDSVAQLQETPGIELYPRGGSYRGLGFNVTTPPFDEFEV